MMRLGYFILGILLATSSAARGENIAVLGIEAIDASESDAARLTEVLRQRITNAPNVTVVTGKDYVELKLVFGCVEEDQAVCMAQAGKSLGADKLIYGSLKGTPQRPADKPTLLLRVLDVKQTKIKYAPSEQLGAQELSAKGMQSLAARLLAALIDLNLDVKTPATTESTVVVESPKASKVSTSRALRIVALTTLVLSAVTAGVAIYTWRHFVSLEDNAYGSLLNLQAAESSYAYNNRAWFAQPTCQLPAQPTSDSGKKAAQTYLSQCSQGNDYANATTALLATTGVLAATALVTFIVSFPLKDREATAAKKNPQSSFVPRLTSLAPTVNAQGGGLVAGFQF